jgi:hypothetical protein
MNSEYWFGELAQSLKNGFLSDSIVLELARVLRDESVSDRQKKLFADAAKVLECAVEGNRWLDDPKMSANASTCAAFFGQAVEAMSIVVTPEEFARRVQSLAETAKQLSEGRTPPSEEMQALRTFFFNAGRTELEKTEYLMNGEKETDRLKWLAAK